MSSMVDRCAEMEKEEAQNKAMRMDEMRIEDVRCAVDWMTERIRKKTGNYSLSFPADWMPETGMVVVASDNTLLAVATLYLEKSSPVAVCGWCVANPQNKSLESYSAINLLMAAMPVYAKRLGAKYLLTTFGNRGINSVLDKCGFIQGETSENKFMIL